MTIGKQPSPSNPEKSMAQIVGTEIEQEPMPYEMPASLWTPEKNLRTI